MCKGCLWVAEVFSLVHPDSVSRTSQYPSIYSSISIGHFQDSTSPIAFSLKLTLAKDERG